MSYVPQNPAGLAQPLDAHRERDPRDAAAPISERCRGAAGRGGPGARRASRDGAEFQRRFPHQLSGGQQQRVCISVALVCEPPVVVLDEPATGLDVVTQARLLDELVRLRREVGVSMIYVTHDLAVVASFADRIAVMYAGRVIEIGPTAEILQSPKHPYTRGAAELDSRSRPPPAASSRSRGSRWASVAVRPGAPSRHAVRWSSRPARQQCRRYERSGRFTRHGACARRT